MLDWVFEGAVTWMEGIVAELLDAVSGLFLDALGTDMAAMEGYFPFAVKAFQIMQYSAWAVLFLVVTWQLFRVFGGPVTDAEDPWGLLARGCLSAFLIAYAKEIFGTVLSVAAAPYTALMDVEMENEDFTFVGIEKALRNGLETILASATVVGLLLIVILMLALGWNYFKLLLETVERYIVVGVLCYTSPLAFSMGASKATLPVLKSWCQMVGSQLLLLVMNVWFLRGFASSAGQYIGNGGELGSGRGSVFLWLFCALAFLKTAQRSDSYLSSLGLSVAQTGSNMGLELLVAARAVGGMGSARTAGSVFGTAAAAHGASAAYGSAAGAAAGGAAGGMAASLAGRFKGNSYVRDATVQGGTRMGAGGGLGFVARAAGSLAAKSGATLTGESVASVASRDPGTSGTLAGDIADRSLANFLPQLRGMALEGTQVTGGRIKTTATSPDGRTAGLEYFHAGQYERPAGPSRLVQASDGSSWYQTAHGPGAGAFLNGSPLGGAVGASSAGEMFPGLADGAVLREVEEGVLEASTEDGTSLWYSSTLFEEPEAPHTQVADSGGTAWYALEPHAMPPAFEDGPDAGAYNRAVFAESFPGFGGEVSAVDGSGLAGGQFEVRHPDGSGTRFYDATQYAAPRGDYRTYQDSAGAGWHAVHGDAAVEQRPEYDNGRPVYENGRLKTYAAEAVRYRSLPQRYAQPARRDLGQQQPAPRRRQ